MTLQQFIDFDHYVRCFTFGKTDITPVAYDPRERRYLVEHAYFSAEVGARVVRDAQPINLALGYEMNTIEFAVQDGVPYAIDYLNPAPDFERDRITPFYFSHVVEKMADLVIDRALNGHPAQSWPRWEEMLGIGAPRVYRRPGDPGLLDNLSHGSHRRLARAAPAGRRIDAAVLTAFAASMRAKKLTFGQRVHCPFLRPFFLTAADEARIRAAAETIALLGERVIRAAFESDDLYHQLGMTEAEDALIDIEPGYPTASTTSRLDAFLLPDALYFAEYNAESPAGIGYTQRLCELFDATAAMGRFRATRQVRFHKVIDALLGALMATYHESGGTARPPTMAIVDWRDVPTWTEFEILRDAFTAAGVPTIVCDPRELVFANGALTAQGTRINLVYRRVLVNDILAKPLECRALVDACAARQLHGQLVPLQARAQEGLLRRADRFRPTKRCSPWPSVRRFTRTSPGRAFLTMSRRRRATGAAIL